MGETGEGFSHYNSRMPAKNPSTKLRAGIIPGQRVSKAKPQRSREYRREMTRAEKLLSVVKRIKEQVNIE